MFCFQNYIKLSDTQIIITKLIKFILYWCYLILSSCFVIFNYRNSVYEINLVQKCADFLYQNYVRNHLSFNYNSVIFVKYLYIQKQINIKKDSIKFFNFFNSRVLNIIKLKHLNFIFNALKDRISLFMAINFINFLFYSLLFFIYFHIHIIWLFEKCCYFILFLILILIFG